VTIRAVIFDFGGVIVPGSPTVDDPDAPWTRFEREHGLAPGSAWRAIYLDNAAWLQLRVGGSSFDEWRAVSTANLAAAAGPEAAERFIAAFWESRDRAGAGQRGDGPMFNDGMIDLVKRLKATHKVSILSNAAPGLEEELREHYAIHDLFDDVINSATVRLAKPDPAIFEVAAARLGLAPAECFFTDDLAHNVASARSVGMTAHEFRGVAGLVAALQAAGVNDR
jgi:putative hydrolase of the HAD superfamily